MPPASVIIATAAMTGGGDVEQATSLVRAGLGPRVDVEGDGQGVLAARCGSRVGCRLLGAWARSSWLPLRARFEELVADLQRAGLELSGPIEHGQGGVASVGR